MDAAVKAEATEIFVRFVMYNLAAEKLGIMQLSPSSFPNVSTHPKRSGHHKNEKC
jgi:hypothetical protein